MEGGKRRQLIVEVDGWWFLLAEMCKHPGGSAYDTVMFGAEDGQKMESLHAARPRGAMIRYFGWHVQRLCDGRERELAPDTYPTTLASLPEFALPGKANRSNFGSDAGVA